MIDELGLATANAPVMVNGHYVVGVVYEEFDDRIQLQVLRDLWVLTRQWPIAINDYQGRISDELLRLSNVETTDEPASLNLVYKVGPEWPYADPDVQQVRRDLELKVKETRLNPNAEVGYYLREQGRDGANLTELYLNRTAPRGNGLSDAMVVLLWGN